MKTSRYILSLVLILNCFCMLAQQNLVLYNMNDVQQSMYANPGQIPQSRINIGLPILSSTYFNFGNNGGKITDLLVKGADDSTRIDLNNFLSKLSASNYITQS